MLIDMKDADSKPVFSLNSSLGQTPQNENVQSGEMIEIAF